MPKIINRADGCYGEWMDWQVDEWTRIKNIEFFVFQDILKTVLIYL